MLRRLLVLCLSLTLPVSALAAVAGPEHCRHGSAESTATSGHEHHSMSSDMAMDHGDHAQHMADASGAEQTGGSECSCGCNCGDSGCAPQGIGFLTASGMKTALLPVSGTRKFLGALAQTAAPHPLDLLRPPSLI